MEKSKKELLLNNFFAKRLYNIFFILTLPKNKSYEKISPIYNFTDIFI